MSKTRLTATIEIGRVPATPKARKELAQQIAADLEELARSVKEPWFTSGLEQRLAASARLAERGHGHTASGTIVLEIGPQKEEKPDA